jgi:hypothetical protein
MLYTKLVAQLKIPYRQNQGGGQLTDPGTLTCISLNN